jgi:ribosomal protein L6P/L9E
VQGKVDPVHAPKALVLGGLVNRAELVKEAMKVGGIFVFCNNPDKVLVIGCDHAAVLEEARKIAEERPEDEKNRVGGETPR